MQSFDILRLTEQAVLQTVELQMIWEAITLRDVNVI